jgi:membrane associated rhomboid family serine protease
MLRRSPPSTAHSTTAEAELVSRVTTAGTPGSDRGSSRRSATRLLAAMVAVMWVVELINSVDSNRLDQAGIRPREIAGLDGVVFAPFLHASFSHLIGNTIPFVILGATIALTEGMRLASVTVVVGLVAGLGTWLIAPGGIPTVGASGVVFGYATYLIGRGVFSRQLVPLAIGVAVGLVFGLTLLYSLIPRTGISWQDHLFGALGGILAARGSSGRNGPAGVGEALH